MSRNFNEDSRVKIPALVHLTRLGYEYLSIKDENIKNNIEPNTNIFKRIFKDKINFNKQRTATVHIPIIKLSTVLLFKKRPTKTLAKTT